VQTTLESNLDRVRGRIAAAAVRAGRDPRAIDLVAVTKAVRAERAAELFRLGVADLGENRADELCAKEAHFESQGLVARWHFLGHLQTNKARRVVERAHAIHSVDSPRLLDHVERLAAELGRAPLVYLQVKLVGGDTRTGATPDEIASLALRGGECKHVRLAGVMAMAAPGAPQAAREVFESAVRLARELEREPETARAFVGGRVRTSLGMSDDFETAIAAGSDLVRIGSSLFEDASGESDDGEAEQA
jgi:pyridoxal phosphate enzyme (YggS family)